MSKMKIRIATILLLISSMATASGHFNLNAISTNTTHSWPINEGNRKFEEASINTTNFLSYFNPANVTVVKKVIDGNNFDFHVVKSILGFKKHFNLLGTIQIQADKPENCKIGEEAYTAHIDFSRSGPEITDTISDFFLHLCTIQSGTQFIINSKNVLYYKGSKFNSIYESIARNLISDQVESLYLSIKTASIAVK